MISDKMEQLGKKNSVIREIFEYGRMRKEQIGAENVFDFSIGNPSIPTPKKVTDTMVSLLTVNDPVDLHGYTSAAGDTNVRAAVCKNLNNRFNCGAKPELIYMTCGAAASLSITLTALINPGDEVIVLAPFFPEYRIFAEKAGARVVSVMCRQDDFSIDIDALSEAITKNTKAVIVNSPNNPTGAVYSEECLKETARMLRQKQKQFGNSIYIIADEPYREIVYDKTVPFIPNLYNNTIFCYSYSKSLSLPGERIGYIYVSQKAENPACLFAAVCGAGRSLGYVCAPSLLQHTIALCADEVADISAYRQSRDLLYESLVSLGFDVVSPDGAFYLFLKSPEPDAKVFCEVAKKYELLLVPSDDFGCPGYVRIAYCVSPDTIKRALPAFYALSKEYRRD